MKEEAARCRGALERCPHPGRKRLDHGAPKISPLGAEASWELSCQKHCRPQCPRGPLSEDVRERAERLVWGLIMDTGVKSDVAT